MGVPNLVTACNFHGQEFLFKMNISNNNLEILITDKSSGEEWQCNYDATYIENLTQKTGNFKQFDIFVAMIKSGLLRTSESVTLDLLTFDDLELLRSRKITKSVGPNSNTNRRYLIVTYVVEFDKIRYPLPLEYCGPPDPVILQGTIKRLELELAKTKEELALKVNNNHSRKVYYLQKQVDELTEENALLNEEIRQLSKMLNKKAKHPVVNLQKAVTNLEKSVVNERNSHHELVEKLKIDKVMLTKELEKVKQSERGLKAKINKMEDISSMGIGDFNNKSQMRNKRSTGSMKTMYRNRSKSPFSISEGGHCKNKTKNNLEKMRSVEDLEWGISPRRIAKSNVRNMSRSSSSASTKFQELYDSDRSRENSKPASPRRRISRSQTPVERSVRNTSNCSVSSTASKRSPMRHKKEMKELDYEKLEHKIATIERMLKNTLKK